MLKLNLKAPQYAPLTEYELRFVGKEVRYLLTQQGAVDLRSRCAVWQSDWPPTTRERKQQLRDIAAWMLRPSQAVR